MIFFSFSLVPFFYSLRPVIITKAATNCKNMEEYTLGFLMGHLALLSLCCGEDQDLCGTSVNERDVLVTWVSRWNIWDFLVRML